MDALEEMALEAYDRPIGLKLSDVSVDYYITKASMRRPSLSSRRGGFDRPRKTASIAPLRSLLLALSVGRFLCDPVHDEVRPDSKALQSRVRSPSAKGPSSC